VGKSPGSHPGLILAKLVDYSKRRHPEVTACSPAEGWRRSKKIRLIESMNPHWHDLAELWYRPIEDGITPMLSTPDPSLG
jgi:hypothetical protein